MGRTIDEWLESLGEGALDEDSVTSLRDDLQKAIQKRDALQTEFDELNHMLTHQPPSAWAKREKKYHDDKKAWDAAQAELNGKVKRLQDEVRTLKDNNRAVVLQEQVQDLESTLKELRKENESVNKQLTERSAALKQLQEDHAKMTKAHQEAVQESVTARMSMRKLEEQLASKTAESVAEASKAAESSRLLQALKRDHNEASLKTDGLKEQIEALRVAQITAQKKAAAEIDAVNKEVQAAREKASAEAAAHAEAASKAAQIASELDMMRQEFGEASEGAREAERTRAAEAKAALSKLNDVHQAELTAVKRQLLGLEDRCAALTSERQTLTKQLKSARSEHEAALRAAKTAAAAAASSPSADGTTVAAAVVAAAESANADPSAFQAADGGINLPAADAAGVLRAPSGAPASPARTTSGVAAAAVRPPSPPLPEGSPRSQGSASPKMAAARANFEGSGTAPVPPAAARVASMASADRAISSPLAMSPTRRPSPPLESAPSAGVARAQFAAAVDASGVPPPIAEAAAVRGSPQPLTEEALQQQDAAPAITPLTIDLPQIKPGVAVDMTDPENVNVSQQIASWSRVCGTVLPPAEQAALIASGHGTILSDTLTALDREHAVASSSRMQVCACKIASSVPMASRPAEYAGGSVLPPMRGLPRSAMAVLRAAARARADRAMVADEMDAAAAAREAAGDEAVASAFARAMATSNAHQDRRLVAVANAVTLAEGVSHVGQPLSRGRIGLLRAAALRSAENAKPWKSVPADEDFLEAFSVAMVSSSVPLPSGEVAAVSDEQRLLFQAAAAAVLSSPDPEAETTAAENGDSGTGGPEEAPVASTRSLGGTGSGSFAVRENGGAVDLTSLPNNPSGRALREYAAQCETTVQVHQAQIEQLNRKLDEKDKELAALEESLSLLAPPGPGGERTLKASLSSIEEQRLDTLQTWMTSGSSKQAERIKSLEAQLLISEQNLTNCKAKLSELGADVSIEEITKPSAGDQLILSGDEDNYLTSLVVKLKVDLAETHGELMHCKRALTRATERETKLQEKVSMLEAPLAPHPQTQRRGGLFTPRPFAQELRDNVAVVEPDESPGAEDTRAHDELSAPEINVGGGGSGEVSM